jgi:hypothetical protein
LKSRWLAKLISGATVACFVLASCLVFTTGCQENGKACPSTCKQDKSCSKECCKATGAKEKCPPGCTKPCCAKKAPEAPKGEAKPAPAPAKETKPSASDKQ